MQPFNLIFSLKMTHPLVKVEILARGVSAVRASEDVQLSLIGSRLRALERGIDEMHLIPLSSQKGGSKTVFVDKTLVLLLKVYYKITLLQLSAVILWENLCPILWCTNVSRKQPSHERFNRKPLSLTLFQ